MHKIILLLLAFISIGMVQAQTALIKDPDGYCNVRDSASVRSKVLDTLHEGRIIFVYPEEAKGAWLLVDYFKGSKMLTGYIHTSRVVLLNNLTAFKPVAANDTLLQFQLDSFQIKIIQGKFVRQGRQLKYATPQGQQTFIKSIDGKFPWGTDGNLPRFEYKHIEMKWGLETLTFPPESFRDLFEPNFHLTSAYRDKSTGKVYVEAMNSDAAGAYAVVWIIQNGQIAGRQTFIPF